MSRIAPKWTAGQALKLFSKVPKRKILPREEKFYQHATADRIAHEPEPVHYYTVGPQEGKVVVLIHGWSSLPAALSDIAFALADKGFRVIAINLPGHGVSRQNSTNVVVCAEALNALLQQLAIRSNIHVVTHSFGSFVIAFAAARYGYQIDKIAMITNPGKMTTLFENFSKLIGLRGAAIRYMQETMNQILGEDYQNVSVEKKMAQSKYNRLLLIHDPEDKITPYSNSTELFDRLPNTALYTIRAAGHSRIVRNKKLIQKLSDFFTQD